jgi:hypothetical protein
MGMNIRGRFLNSNITLRVTLRGALRRWFVAAFGVWFLWSANPTYGADIFRHDPLPWIYVVGEIEPGDEYKFKSVLQSAINKGIVIGNVAIYSQSGAVEAAIRIGRYIRTMRLRTSATYVVEPYETNYCPIYAESTRVDSGMSFNPKTKQGDPRCLCASACFLIWMGGVGGGKFNIQERILIHRISFKGQYGKLSEQEARIRYEAAQKRVEEYLKEMGAPDTLIRRMFSIPSSETSYLTKTELGALKNLLPPYLEELYDAKCGKDRECRDKFERQLYFEAGKVLENMN